MGETAHVFVPTYLLYARLGLLARLLMSRLWRGVMSEGAACALQPNGGARGSLRLRRVEPRFDIARKVDDARSVQDAHAAHSAGERVVRRRQLGPDVTGVRRKVQIEDRLVADRELASFERAVPRDLNPDPMHTPQ